MYLNQPFCLVIDFLKEGCRSFLRVYFFDVARPPAITTGNVKPVAPPTIRQIAPVWKFTFVLLASGRGVSLEQSHSFRLECQAASELPGRGLLANK
ncbi:MAG: hypothetical protein AB1750_16915 [Chloroflexota bacterium]